MTYYITSGGFKQGPMSLSELNEGLRSGRFSYYSSLAWFEGCDCWIPVRSIPGVESPPEPSNEPLSIWSFVLSLLGLLCCGFILSVPAVILGHISLNNIKNNRQLGGRGLAIAGISIGYVTTAFWLLYLVVFGGFAALSELAK